MVPTDDQKPRCEWFLPHIPMVRPEKETAKVRMVFDGSAACEGKSLNKEALPGSKLQSDITDILIKFRKEPVAFAGDISQMFHQLVLRPDDRPLRRFLWRNLDIQVKSPKCMNSFGLYLVDVTASFTPSTPGNNTQNTIETNTC